MRLLGNIYFEFQIKFYTNLTLVWSCGFVQAHTMAFKLAEKRENRTKNKQKAETEENNKATDQERKHRDTD